MVDDLCTNEDPILDTATEYSILQLVTKKDMTGYSCQITKSSFLFYCGSFSHYKLMDVPSIEITEPINSMECRNLVDKRQFETPDGKRHKILLQGTNVIKSQDLGLIKDGNDKVSCEGEKYKIGGSIINMSSQMAHVGGPIRSVYNMTKAGLEGLTRGMAIDLAKSNIRVNSVCPTFVVTPMTKKFLKSKKFKSDTLKKIPMGKFAELSDVATAVAFLASDSSKMITGTSILIDGGWTAI